MEGKCTGDSEDAKFEDAQVDTLDPGFAKMIAMFEVLEEGYVAQTPGGGQIGRTLALVRVCERIYYHGDGSNESRETSVEKANCSTNRIVIRKALVKHTNSKRLIVAESAKMKLVIIIIILTLSRSFLH